MPFRSPTTVLRRGAGAYVRGVWQPGPETPDTIQASIQPATPGDYERMQPMQDGRRTAGALCLRTASRLTVAREGGTEGDAVLHDGRRWIVTAEASWQVLASRVSHYAYLIVPEEG